MITDSLSLETQIFGDSSFIYMSEIENVINVTNSGMSDFLFFKLLVIGLMLYFFMVIRMKKCSKLLSKTLKTNYVSDELFENSSLVSDKFLLRSKEMWMVSTGVIIYKILDVAFSNELIELPYIYLIILPLMLAFPIIFYLQKIVLRAVGSLTFNEDLINKLLYLNSLFLSTSAILLTPFAIICALYSGSLLIILAFLGALIAILLLIMWLYKTYMLFVEKKVSSLNWFLYLCTVEIFPLTLILFFLKP